MSILFLISANSAPRDVIVAPVYEDSPIVQSMAAVAVDALTETHPECADPRFVFNVDASDGVQVLAVSDTCEYAAEFYRAPDTLRWSFAVTGS